MKQRTHNSFLNVILIFGAMLIGSWPQTGLAQLSCPITRITNTPSEDITHSVSANNQVDRIVFTSTNDITGGNPNHIPQLFLFNTTTNVFTQITSITDVVIREVEGAISGDGTKIAVVTDSDLTGSNSDRSAELFRYDTATGSFTQLTSGASFVALGSHAISANGNRIAFNDFSNLTGGNPDENSEIFLVDVAANTISQITNTTTPFQAAGSIEPAMNADGTRIAFSKVDGAGASDILLFDGATNNTTQITNSFPQLSLTPSVNSNANRIAFASTDDLIGDNPNNNSEIFVRNTTTNTFTQITNTSSGEGAFAPVISTIGNHIAFISDFNGGGTFRYEISTNTLTQLNNEHGFARPAISSEGDRIAFRLTDKNVYLAICDLESTDLLVTQTDSPDPVIKNNNLTYTITVANNLVGGSDAINTVLDDTIPSSTTFVSLTAPAGWTCTTPAVGSTGTVHCSTASLLFNSSANFTLVVKVPSTVANGTNLTNTATASSETPDPNPENNTEAEITSVTTPSQSLKLTVIAQGFGSVTSNPAGINCRPTCIATYNNGTQVTLTAVPARGNQFIGWSGVNCPGTGTCTVTMLGDRTVKATFRRQ